MYNSKKCLLLFICPQLFLLNSCARLDALDLSTLENDETSHDELLRYGPAELSKTPLVVYLVDNKEPQSILYEQSIRKIADYTKIPYCFSSIYDFSSTPIIAKETKVIAYLNSRPLSQLAIKQLITFVSQGGTLFLPFAHEDRRISFLLGFKPEAEYAVDNTAAGIYFNTPFLPNLQGKTNGEQIVHYGFAQANFSNKVKVLATASNNRNYPLVVENSIGEGRVIFFNSSCIFSKADRGLFLSALLTGLEGLPYPIANVSTIFLDDFPSPLYQVKAQPIQAEMNLTMADFVKDIWWPDMQELAEKYNIQYSAMLTFDYKNKTSPPFIFDQWDQVKTYHQGKQIAANDYLVHKVAAQNHELAFHGYNHVSLTASGWPKKNHMLPAFQSVEKKWRVNEYGPLPVTYVPPSNIIDYYGIQTLKKGMPSLQYLCSLYLGEIYDGGGREFDFDPYHNGFFDYPRITSGFYLDDRKMYAKESLFLVTGIWTHFVHPDDVYQIQTPFNKSRGNYEFRNGKNLGWRKTKGKKESLLQSFTDYISQTVKAYPESRFLSAKSGAKLVNQWRASQFTHHENETAYQIKQQGNDTSVNQKQYWFLYASTKHTIAIEGDLIKQAASYSKTPYLDGFLYMIKTEKRSISTINLNHKNRSMQPSTDLVLANYQQHLEEEKKHLLDLKSQALSDQEITSALLEEINQASRIDTTIWNKYARKMSWNAKGEQVWQLYEEYTKKNNLPHNLLYSVTLATIIDYPSAVSQEKWTAIQWELSKEDPVFLTAYLANYDSPENHEKIEATLSLLLDHRFSINLHKQYIQHLMTYNPPKALEVLTACQPTTNYEDIAAEVAWFMANQNNLCMAYHWSLLTKEITCSEQIQWLQELGEWQMLEKHYKNHLSANPADNSAKATMASILLDRGALIEAWLLVNSLQHTPDKIALQTRLNAIVLEESPRVQQLLLTTAPALFFPEIAQKINIKIRQKYGHHVLITSAANSNRTTPQAWKNSLTYHWFSKEIHKHGLSATYSTMYDVPVQVSDTKNSSLAVGGLQYQFSSSEFKSNIQYTTKSRIEYASNKQWYFQAGVAASRAKKNGYTSVQIDLFPAETGPAYNKNIYRGQLNIYDDFFWLKTLYTSIAFEGNYYTASKRTSEVQIEESYEATITSRIGYDSPQEKKMKFIPFLEAAYTQASIGQSAISPALGYPYWMIDDRLYGGGGLLWKWGKSDENLQLQAEASYFLDDYTTTFQRITGKLEYQLFDFTAISAAIEIYLQTKFYSNNLLVGLKHNLKTRKRR